LIFTEKKIFFIIN